MITINNIYMPLGYDENMLKREAARRMKVPAEAVLNMVLRKKSVDARHKDNVRFMLSVDISLQNEKKALENLGKDCKDINKAEFYRYEQLTVPPESKHKTPVVVGFGPAGIFAALVLARGGMKPVVIERGSNVDTRIEKVNEFWNGGKLDERCNVQFGEGGAGTFSDGKLTTGTKDKRIRFVFGTFAEFGAPQEILYEAKPHIGTDRLVSVVKNIRNEIIKLGGTVMFDTRFIGIKRENNAVCAVECISDGKTFDIETDSVILAVGHSARDTFKGLYDSGIALEQKNFAVGVRIEHLQKTIDKAMYGKFAGHKRLPPASYKLVKHLKNGRTVYTFCMCPGGKVVNASSEQGMTAVNGMSCFARDGENANSALLVNITTSDFKSEHALAGVEFQRKIEQSAYAAGGSDNSAPFCTVRELMERKTDDQTGNVKPSVLPKGKKALPDEYLPDFVCESLREGITAFGKMIDGFDSPDAVLTGAETRSSSPVRILRNENCVSVSLGGLYPCGEGAGYAGGIVSAAVDGIRCAEQIIISHSYPAGS